MLSTVFAWRWRLEVCRLSRDMPDECCADPAGLALTQRNNFSLNLSGEAANFDYNLDLCQFEPKRLLRSSLPLPLPPRPLCGWVHLQMSSQIKVVLGSCLKASAILVTSSSDVKKGGKQVLEAGFFKVNSKGSPTSKLSDNCGSVVVSVGSPLKRPQRNKQKFKRKKI